MIDLVVINATLVNVLMFLVLIVGIVMTVLFILGLIGSFYMNVIRDSVKKDDNET